MILGLSTSTFTLLHVAVSLVGILTGLIVLVGLLGARRQSVWTALFLMTTAATCISGFFFPASSFGPSHIVAVLSLVALAVALLARYVNDLAGASRWLYVVAVLLALYLNSSVAVVEAFRKLAFLEALAPTEAEPPFLYAQLALFGVFFVLSIIAVIRFRPAPPEPPLDMDIRRAGA